MEENGSDASSDFAENRIIKQIAFPKSQPVENNLAPAPNANHYNMKHPNRGIAVIFNHYQFYSEESSTREGTIKDGENLKEIFESLGFKVMVYEDLSTEKIHNKLLEVSEMDHSDSDCLVIAVMTHGTDNRLKAYDDTYPTERLWKYFTAKICPTLAGKPKLFFVQACRGGGRHQGHILSSKTVEEDASQNNTTAYSIPIMADILVMYSTVAGFQSLRNPVGGSYFVQSLVKQLRTHHEKEDLLTILTYVNREVAIDFTKYQPNSLKEVKQMCCIVSMLTRRVYFTEKKTRDLINLKEK